MAPASRQAAPRSANRKSLPARTPRTRLVTRLWRAAEKEMSALEARLTALPHDDPAHEEGAKALGLLARLVKDLMALDAAVPATARGITGERQHDDGRDLEAFRAELARKLEALALEEEAGASGAAEPG